MSEASILLFPALHPSPYESLVDYIQWIYVSYIVTSIVLLILIATAAKSFQLWKKHRKIKKSKKRKTQPNFQQYKESQCTIICKGPDQKEFQYQSEHERQYHLQSKTEKGIDILVQYYSRSKIVVVWEVLLTGLNLASCVIFVYLSIRVASVQLKASENGIEMYESEPYWNIFQENWLIIVEFVFSCVLVVDILIHAVISQRKTKEVFSFTGLLAVDFLTSIPAFVAMGTRIYFYGFQFLRFIRVFKNIEYFERYFERGRGVGGQMVKVIFTVFSLIFCTACASFVVENDTINANGKITNLYNAIYFTVVTITTVGYGDIVPTTALGKGFIMMMIIFSIALLPMQAERLIRLSRQRTDRGHRKFKGGKHIVVITHDATTIVPFLKEFFHADRAKTDMNICLVVPSDGMTVTIENIVQTPKYDLHLSIMEGSPLDFNDLRRFRLQDSPACFLFANKFADDRTFEDAKTVLESFAIMNYAPHVKLFAEVLQLEVQRALRHAGAYCVVSNTELTMRIIAQGSICPGLCALIGNITKSCTYTPSPSNTLEASESQYVEGLGNEVYKVKLPNSLVGCKFLDLVKFLYDQCSILLIGICCPYEDCAFQLNPGKDYRIEEGAHGLIIAQNEQDASKFLSDKCATSLQIPRANELVYSDNLLLDISIYARKQCDSFTLQHEDDNPEDPKAQDSEKKLTEVTIQDVRKDDTIKKHIVVIGTTMWDVYLFIKCLRSYPLKTIQPVVILAEHMPNDAWKKVREYSKVYFVEGNPTLLNDLKRSGAFECERVILLGGGPNCSDLSVDAKNIIVFRLLHNFAPFVIIELVHSINTRLLGSRKYKQESELFGDDHHENPFYAAGQVFTSSSVDTLLGQSYYNDHITGVIEVLTDGVVLGIDISAKMPHFIGKQYSILFSFLLSHFLICLALYRRSATGNRIVYTNPQASTSIDQHDIAIVLDKGNIDQNSPNGKPST